MPGLRSGMPWRVFGTHTIWPGAGTERSVQEGKRLGPGENSKERHSGLEETAGVRSLRQDGSGDSMDGMRKGVNLHQDTELGKARKVLEQG